MWSRMVCLVLLLLPATLLAQEPDAIRLKISPPRNCFFKERDRAEQKLLELLTRQEQAVKQAGDLKAWKHYARKYPPIATRASCPR